MYKGKLHYHDEMSLRTRGQVDPAWRVVLTDEDTYREVETQKYGHFRAAREASWLSPHPHYRIGAVVCNKKPLATGYNQYYKTDPSVKEWGEGRQQRLCAERHACKGLSDEKLVGSILYVWRQTPGGRQAMARPCESCVKYLIDKRVKRVYYSTDLSFDVLNLPAPE